MTLEAIANLRAEIDMFTAGDFNKRLHRAMLELELEQNERIFNKLIYISQPSAAQPAAAPETGPVIQHGKQSCPGHTIEPTATPASGNLESAPPLQSSPADTDNTERTNAH